MDYKEAKNKFVQTWGALGSQWGINKTMAQIHALLMVSHEAVSMEDIYGRIADFERKCFNEFARFDGLGNCVQRIQSR